MVRILSDAQTLAAVRIRHSCALLTLREGSISSVIKACTPLVKSASCVLIGPGLDTDDPLTGALLEYFIVNAGKLVIDAGQRFLKPLNPQYPIIPINGNCRIIGVVVDAKITNLP